MKQLITKIVSVFLSVVVLFSTLSFTVSEHYCGDSLISTGLFSKAKSCGMEQNLPPLKNDCSIEKSNCCNDALVVYSGQTELKTDSTTLNFKQQIFIASFVISYTNLFEGLTKQNNPFKDYSPPLIVKDIQILDEVFLI